MKDELLALCIERRAIADVRTAVALMAHRNEWSPYLSKLDRELAGQVGSVNDKVGEILVALLEGRATY